MHELAKDPMNAPAAQQERASHAGAHAGDAAVALDTGAAGGRRVGAGVAAVDAAAGGAAGDDGTAAPGVGARLAQAGSVAMLTLLRLVSFAPYAVLRRIGDAGGMLLYWLVVPRRRIARTNLRLCFPELSEAERVALMKAHFRYFTRSFFDRFVLWYQPESRIRDLVRVEGVAHLEAVAGRPVILLAPHFVGLDAGGTRMSIERRMFSMFANQKNQVLNQAMREGRSRFNDAMLLSRLDGLRTAIRLLRQQVPFYFLPDMDLGARDAVFVPFFGVPAATVTSVARLAQMTGAVVVPCVTEMTDDGYVCHFHPAWEDYPGADLAQATARMNRFIEDRVREMPAQYLWTHKRFKTRPPGEPDLYARAAQLS
ncbi:MAG: lipid A biosynthesis acyltransferase [Lautropia sp.]